MRPAVLILLCVLAAVAVVVVAVRGRHWRDGESFPIGWCHKRIVNGPEDNVWFKYKLIRDGRAAGPATQPAGDEPG